MVKLVYTRALRARGANNSVWVRPPPSALVTKNFFEKVYEVVQKIPPGYVATYTLIADILDTRDARRVGHALHANPDGFKTPCHRVVFSDGKLAPGYVFGGPNEQRRRLELEGITFNDEKVNLSSHLWRPA